MCMFVYETSVQRSHGTEYAYYQFGTRNRHVEYVCFYLVSNAVCVCVCCAGLCVSYMYLMSFNITFLVEPRIAIDRGQAPSGLATTINIMEQ